MIGRPLKVSGLQIETVPISRLTMQAEDPESETVGIYLLTGDDLPGQAILTLSLVDAMYLADWLLEERPGTTTKLNPLVCSALSEFGNQALSSFLNALAEFTATPLRLSPPAVMVDMLATVLETTVIPVAPMTDELLIIETNFTNVESSLLTRFWVLPDPDALPTDRAKTK
jgi:chemotaxis protein CheY-P-specific phosphatase CheC